MESGQTRYAKKKCAYKDDLAEKREILVLNYKRIRATGFRSPAL